MDIENYAIQQNGLRVLLDWISFTVTSPMTVDEVIEFLGFKPTQFSLLPKGGMGYKSILKLDGYPVSVLYDGQPGMGVHVTVSGTAVPVLLEAYKSTLSIPTPFGVGYDIWGPYLIQFLSDVLKIGQFSRLDLAIDDIGGKYYSTNDLVHTLEAGLYVSKFRRWRNVVESETNGNKTGHTIYMGSGSSDILLRVYDKRLEQNKKLEASGKPLITHDWIRWELEIKKDRANQAASALIHHQELGVVTIGILSSYLRLITLDDCNKSRCSTSPLWKKFLDNVDKLVLSVPCYVKTLDDKKQWIVSQVMPTLAGIVIADEGALDIITDHLNSGALRMSRDMQDILSKVCPGWQLDYDGGLMQ